MNRKNVIVLPNDHLRQRSKKVGLIDEKIKKLIQGMEDATLDWEDSREHEVGVALAAVQVDKLVRIVVIRNNFDNKEDRTFTAFINPVITKYEGSIEEDFEGCLSVPDVYGKVPRHTKVRVKALNIDGREFRVTAEGFLARVFQHEIDHTNGIIFVDHIKENPKAFYRLKEDSHLEELDYEKASEPIVFFGSGPVAAESLVRLADYFNIEGVVTKPRPPHHKGSVPVLEAAEKLGLPVSTATDKKTLDTLFASRPFKSNLAILVDFGIIVSQDVIDYFPRGIINSHFSLLPEWRGADPITFSILSGQERTGISLMLLTAGMDEGPLLAQSPYDVPAGATTPSLTSDLIDLSSEALQAIVPLWLANEVFAAPQETVTMAVSPEPSYSRKLTKEDGVLSWAKPATVLEREVRAFAGWPKSRASFGGLVVVVTEATVIDAVGTPGTTAVIDKKPVVYCAQGALVLERLKPAGKQEMTGGAFLAGYKRIFLES